MPLALPVTLLQAEGLIAQAIRLAAPEFRKEFAEIADQKVDDVLYFLEMEDRRINPD